MKIISIAPLTPKKFEPTKVSDRQKIEMGKSAYVASRDKAIKKSAHYHNRSELKRSNDKI